MFDDLRPHLVELRKRLMIMVAQFKVGLFVFAVAVSVASALTVLSHTTLVG